MLNRPVHIPCTPSGILDLMSDYDLTGKNVVIIGRSNIVGKPLAINLINEGATVTVMNSKTTTETRTHLLSIADVVIVATGQPGTIKVSDCKKADIIIDVGINRVNGKLVGDVEHDTDFKGRITPVPGGVGPMTVAHLMKNTLEAYKMLHE